MFVFEKANQKFRFPIITFCLIVITLCTQFLETNNTYAFTPKKEFGLSLFSSFFFNSSFVEWTTNAIYLYMFADNIEDVVGPLNFFFLFLFFGILTNLTYYLFHMNSIIPVVGTSGVVSGFLGMYFVFFPKVKSTMVFEKIAFKDVPIYFSLSIWILIQGYLYIVELHSDIRSTYAGQVVAFFIGMILANGFVRLKYLDRLEHNLRLTTFQNKTVLCPSCNHPIPAKKYGRFHCHVCHTNFFFDRKGKKFLP
ncbi:rhomboid family intramembrane serine protease [Leptospira levettii]|uniref:Rhomboid family intramembrane serine protease n=1 Tax=Leptospira levettii TaxID=2023178 RepID=A0ABY2MP51_9LEPT|nr:rhomboid family intramembrane serine protease [Leptospira levettii]PKA23896.1 rhomboid family intramembrane serine protease [Leptospira sp. mixed culture ATI2-C-A1]TGL17578.1 rhomboid family intramembrane serine protease [Leptospira levettii]TGL71503.1 rhomboid family intramembrane serine protease [Leptospira levettii]TGM24626.1 rhomboid family intramembrane serine protease [Leptospira levettii]TGM68706.1 rhomboid family intramembrane serine protease [Leptospira levettii]